MNAITINGTTWQHCATCAVLMRPDSQCPHCGLVDNSRTPVDVTALNRSIFEAS